MKILFSIGFLSLTLILAAPRSKNTVYDLPASAKLLVGDIRTTFVCRRNGYYADQDNFCKIFHVCHTFIHPDGTSKMVQWSFICGNKTIFNQFSLTCSYPEDAVPCGSAGDFWYLNANIGVGPNVPFHNEQDVVRAVAVTENSSARSLKPERIPQFYSTSLPITTVGPPTPRTFVWKSSLVVVDRSPPSRVPVFHPTTRSPFAQPPLRPHAMPLLPPSSLPERFGGAYGGGGGGGGYGGSFATRRPARQPVEEICLILND